MQKIVIFIGEKYMIDSHLIDLAKEIKNVPECIRAAIVLAKKTEKYVYLQMRIDSGNWAKMMAGKANFSADRIKEFCNIIGNDLLLIFLTYQSGYEIRILPKTLEEKIAEKDKKIEKLIRELETLKEIFKESLVKTHSDTEIQKFKKG